MRLYGSVSPKRHIAWASSSWIAKLDLGPLKGWKPSMNPDKKTAHVYKTSTGEKKYQGSRHLKGTQCLVRLVVLTRNGWLYVFHFLLVIL